MVCAAKILKGLCAHLPTLACLVAISNSFRQWSNGLGDGCGLKSLARKLSWR